MFWSWYVPSYIYIYRSSYQPEPQRQAGARYRGKILEMLEEAAQVCRKLEIRILLLLSDLSDDILRERENEEAARLENASV